MATTSPAIGGYDSFRLLRSGFNSSGDVHYFECSLVSDVPKWIHVSLMTTKRHRNAFELCLSKPKHCWEMASLLLLFYGVSKCGPHIADGFLMPIIHVGFIPRSFLRCLLSQLSRTPSIGRLSIRDRGLSRDRGRHSWHKRWCTLYCANTYILYIHCVKNIYKLIYVLLFTSVLTFCFAFNFIIYTFLWVPIF